MITQSVSCFSNPVVIFVQLEYYFRLLLMHGNKCSIEEDISKSDSEVLMKNKPNIVFTIEGNQLNLYILRV